MALTGCAAVRQALGRELVPVDTEVELGRRLATQVEAQQPVLQDADIQRYLRFLAAPLIERAWRDRPGIDYRVTVLDDPQSVNAFALPGGPTYVYSGLLLLAADEAEVAGVLAHELGHVVGRHSANRMATQLGLEVLLSIALGEQPAALAKLAGDAAGAGALARFSREDELEADRYGVEYAIEAGYDPRGLVTFFDKLRQLEGGKRSGIEQFLASHPATAERIERIQKRVEGAGGPAGERHPERYLEMTAPLR